MYKSGQWVGEREIIYRVHNTTGAEEEEQGGVGRGETAFPLGQAMEDVEQQMEVCCSVLQCVAVCCSVLQCVAVCCSGCSLLQYIAVRCSTLQ